MSPISNELSSSLDELNALISKAEAKLRKLPSSETAFVSLEHVLNDERLYLGYTAEDGLHVANESEFVDHVCNLCMNKRIQVAKLIPELLEKASDEEKVREELQKACCSLEQALAD